MWWWSLSSDQDAGRDSRDDGRDACPGQSDLLAGRHVLVTGARGAIGQAVMTACARAGAATSGGWTCAPAPAWRPAT